MNGQINSKNVGMSVGILACFYLLYTQHLIMVRVKSLATEINAKQLQAQSRATGTNEKQLQVQSQDTETNGKQSIETPEHAKDTVLTEVAKVPDFADDRLDVAKLPTDQYMLYELFWKLFSYSRTWTSTFTHFAMKYTMVNTFQYVCSHQVRFGPTADTGYDVCLDEPYRPGQPCIVYSFGSLFLFGFEEYAVKHHKCEVHTYDPSHPIANHKIPQGVNFHLVGLGDSVTTNSIGWKMQTFSDIRRNLNHSGKTIDILKIDIEGGEWVSLAHALRSGELRFVKQLQIELHLWGQQRVGMSLVGKLTVLKQLYEQGFRIFYHEPWPTVDCNRLMRPPHPQITLCVILSLVNTKYQPN